MENLPQSMFKMIRQMVVAFNAKDMVKDIVSGILSLTGFSIPESFVTHLLASAENWIAHPTQIMSAISSSDFVFPENISQLCKRDLLDVVSTMISGTEIWPWEMLDSYGKPPSGFLHGNFYWTGNFWQCVGVVVNEKFVVDRNMSTSLKTGKNRFVGEYCLVKFTIPVKNANLNTFMDNIGIGGLQLAVCLPSTCSLEDKRSLFNHHLGKFLHVNIEQKNCQTADIKPMDGLAVILTIIILLVVTLVMLSTVLEYHKSKHSSVKKINMDVCNVNQSKNRISQFLGIISQIFSVQTALKTIGKTYEVDNSENVITCLYGLKFLGACLLIWLHNLGKGFITISWKNVLDAETLFGYQLVKLQSQVYNLMSCYFVMRFIIPYFGVICFIAGPFYYLSRGPFWAIALNSQSACRANIWYQITLTSNYIRPPADACVVGEWYLGTEWQLHLLCVPIVWLMIRRPKLGLGAAVSGVFIFFVVMVIRKFWVPNETLFVNIPLDYRKSEKKELGIVGLSSEFYTGIHSRASAFLIGMLFGYFLFYYKNSIISKTIYRCGWVFTALSLIVLVSFANIYFISNGMPPVTGWIHYVFSVVCFPLSVGLIIVYCVHHPYGVINRFLSAKLFQILGKLSLGMYLNHFIAFMLYRNSCFDPSYLSYAELVFSTVMQIVISIALSPVQFILFESPTEKLRSMIQARP
ncbi:hypothetical protein CHUAL_003580 [Chamberlinius hualienensis]